MQATGTSNSALGQAMLWTRAKPNTERAKSQERAAQVSRKERSNT